MEGQMCLFSSNRQWESSNQPPPHPNMLVQRPAGRAGARRAHITASAWDDGSYRTDAVRRSFVWLHALLLINSHSGWIALCVGARPPRVMKHFLWTFSPSSVIFSFWDWHHIKTSIILYILQTFKCIMFAHRFLFVLWITFVFDLNLLLYFHLLKLQVNSNQHIWP